MKSKRMATAVAALMGTAALLAGCGGGGGGGAGDDGSAALAESKAAFDSAVFAARPWDQLQPAAADRDGPKAGSMPTTVEERVGTKIYACTVQDYSLTSTPREFVSISPDLRVSWPGALVQGRSHYEEGGLVPLVIDQRAPLEISIDLLRRDNVRTVASPSQGSVGSAIGDLVDLAAAAGHRAPSDAVYQMQESHSASQSALKLGLTAEYLGGSVESKLEVDKTAEERTVTAYFMQRAYTITARTPARPSDVLGDGFTSAHLQALSGDAMSDINPPLFVSSVTYGRVFMYKMTAKASASEIKAAIEGSYSNVTGSVGGVAEGRWRQVLAESRIDIASFGGEESQILALIRSGKLGDYFADQTSLTAMRPISFTLTRLVDNRNAGIVRTTDYQLRNCVYSRDDVTQAIGERYGIKLLTVRVPFDCDSGADPGDMFGRFDVLNTDRAGNNTSVGILVINESSARSVASGDTVDLKDPVTLVNRYYGHRFQLSGELIDADSGLNGADDLIGRWSAFNLPNAGIYSRTASGNCNGSNPTLRYQLTFDSYLFP